MDLKNIGDKEWLDLCWKHFQQHAQQRIQYFNYFVIFSTILTTGFVATFQSNYRLPVLGLGIGIIQAILSIMFYKIDQRNKFLTKQAEKVIMQIETSYSNNEYNIFSAVETATTNLKTSEDERHQSILTRQISHGLSYKIIYFIFFMLGIFCSLVSIDHTIKYNKSRTDINIENKSPCQVIETPTSI